MGISREEFAFVRDLVRARSGIQLEDTQQYLVETRLMQLAEHSGAASPSDFIQGLKAERSHAAHEKVVEALVTHETYFFRDVIPFEALKKEIFPELLAKRARERKLAIWCCGCSTGQEPYSLAMILREHFPQSAAWNIEILATDISNAALARAREGKYSQMEINRGLPAQLLLKYFQQQASNWTISEELRRMVKFQHFNLAQSWSALPPQDIICMRNVLIYFGVATRQEILAKTRRVLASDGYLLLGAAETTLTLDACYEKIEHGKAVFYQIGNHV